MTDYWESEYKHSFKWPNCIGTQRKKDAENQVEVAVINESIQTTDTIPTTDDIEVINLPQDSPKGEKVDNPPIVKRAFASKAKTGDKSESIGKREKKLPEMLSYGWGNNHPTVPGNFMKTFNVSVPSEQVFPSTRERLERKDKIAKDKKKTTQVITQPETEIRDALKQYLEAKQRLEKIQTMYKSEYQMEYVNWAEPVKQIINPSKGAAGLPSDYHDKDKRAQIVSKINKEVEVVRETISTPKNNSSQFHKNPNEKIGSAASVKSNQSLSPIKSVSPVKLEAEVSESPFLIPQNVYDQLKESESPVRSIEKMIPAGVSDAKAFANKERRHYPEKESEFQKQLNDELNEFKLATEDLPTKESSIQDKGTENGRILMYNIYPPTTWRLAQDLLERAHRRSQNLNEDS